MNSTEKDLLASYETEKKLTAEIETLREELAATRPESSAAVAAAQAEAAKKTTPPAAPAAPPVPLPTNTSAYLRLPIAEQEKIEAEHPGHFDSLLAQRPGIRITNPLDGRLYGPGEVRTGTSHADLGRAAETAARHRATLKNAFAGMPDRFTSQNGRPTVPPAPSHPIVPTPAPMAGKKTAAFSAARR